MNYMLLSGLITDGSVIVLATLLCGLFLLLDGRLFHGRS
jgi:hypothetical protein